MRDESTLVQTEATNLTETHAGRVENGEHDPVAKRANGCEEGQKLVDRENDRQVTFAMTVRDALDQFGPVEDVQIEEARGTDALVVPAVRDLLHVAEEEQVLLNLGTPEPVRGAAEVSGKTGNHMDVDVLGAGGHVADAQGLAHLLAERGGGSDHERSPFSEIESVDHLGDPREGREEATRSRRDRSTTRSAPRSGFVQLGAAPDLEPQLAASQAR
jgi:hypothetical protein